MVIVLLIGVLVRNLFLKVVVTGVDMHGCQVFRLVEGMLPCILDDGHQRFESYRQVKQQKAICNWRVHNWLETMVS